MMHGHGEQEMSTSLGKAMSKTKSKKQVGYLMSKGSPLSPKQKKKLAGEMHSGKVKVG